jgi:hypothetical protein
MKTKNPTYIPTPLSISKSFSRARVTIVSALCPLCGRPIRIFESGFSVGLKCPTGCRRNLILAKVGLKPADLFSRWEETEQHPTEPLTGDYDPSRGQGDYPHLSKNVYQIKALAEAPETADRWCVRFKNRLVSSQRLSILANPDDPATLGSYRDCRVLLGMVTAAEGLTAICCFEGKTLRLFPLNGSEDTSAEVSAVQENHPRQDGTVKEGAE